jgi:ABC-2 type transport system ATP-binding protein
MNSTSLVIETHGLRKVFGQTVAVDSLDLTVERGEAFGFLGPNGAGKTTAMKMLLGLVTPTAGSATVLGRPLGDRQTRARIGFLPEHFRFHQWLTAAELLDLHGRLYGMPADRRRRRVPELLELVGLSKQADVQLGAFSKGMLQRIGLAQALINEPELVFLDEPTSGLDPLGRRLVRDIIKDLRQRGATVFLNSHFLSEVEVTCDRVAFIKRGRVVRFADVDQLVNGETVVELRVGETPPQLIEGLTCWGRDVRVDGRRITLTVENDSALPAIANFVVAQGVELYAMTPQRMSLEELFVSIIGPGERDG